MTAVKNQDKKDILPESPILAPIITATNVGTKIASIDISAIIESGTRCRVMKPNKKFPGRFIVAANKIDTTKKISLRNAGDIRIAMTRKTAFIPM